MKFYFFIIFSNKFAFKRCFCFLIWYYEIYIPNELTSLENLVITTKNDIQTYEVIGNSDFEVGENTVIIRVKNSLDEVFDYTLTVYREANSDPNLAGISFITPEYVIEDFDEDNYEYNVEGLLEKKSTSGKTLLEYTYDKNSSNKSINSL